MHSTVAVRYFDVGLADHQLLLEMTMASSMRCVFIRAPDSLTMYSDDVYELMLGDTPCKLLKR